MFFNFLFQDGSEVIEKVKQNTYNGSVLLPLLYHMANRKVNKTDRAVKYPETLREVASYIYLSGGRNL